VAAFALGTRLAEWDHERPEPPPGAMEDGNKPSWSAYETFSSPLWGNDLNLLAYRFGGGAIDAPATARSDLGLPLDQAGRGLRAVVHLRVCSL